MILYHNARCSKSREALQLLEDKGYRPEIRNYLKEAPSESEIKDLLSKLGCSALDLIRKDEAIYKEKAGTKLSEKQLIKLMHQHPILIQRPILVLEGKAIIGRPPLVVLDFAKAAKKKSSLSKK